MIRLEKLFFYKFIHQLFMRPLTVTPISLGQVHVIAGFYLAILSRDSSSPRFHVRTKELPQNLRKGEKHSIPRPGLFIINAGSTSLWSLQCSPSEL